MTDRDIKFKIIKRLAILEYNSQGWGKELNIIKWNDSEPKYDIRYWDANHEKMGRGMTFTVEHMKLLKAYLNSDPTFDGPVPEIPDKGAEMRAKKAAKAAEKAAKKEKKDVA